MPQPRSKAQGEHVRQLLAEVARLQDLVRPLAERVAGQAELLERRAERVGT